MASRDYIKSWNHKLKKTYCLSDTDLIHLAPLSPSSCIHFLWTTWFHSSLCLKISLWLHSRFFFSICPSSSPPALPRSPPPPHPYPNFRYSFWFLITHQDQLALSIHNGYGTLHRSTVNLPGTISITRIGHPSPNRHQLERAPHLGGGASCISLSLIIECWLACSCTGLVQAANVWFYGCRGPDVFFSGPPWSDYWILQSIVPLSQCSLNPVRRW